MHIVLKEGIIHILFIIIKKRWIYDILFIYMIFPDWELLKQGLLIFHISSFTIHHLHFIEEGLYSLFI